MQWRSQYRSFFRENLLTLNEQRYFWGHRLSKHKIAIYSRNVGDHGRLGPTGYDYAGMQQSITGVNETEKG